MKQEEEKGRGTKEDEKERGTKEEEKKWNEVRIREGKRNKRRRR